MNEDMFGFQDEDDEDPEVTSKMEERMFLVVGAMEGEVVVVVVA